MGSTSPGGGSRRRPCQKASFPIPQDATTPAPVTATRRSLMISSSSPPSGRSPPCSQLRLHQIERALDGLDAFELGLVHADVELLLERHDELDEVETVGVEVVSELGGRRDL